MAEPRKIVLILGNGFDLDLGHKTSFKDFWKSDFCPKDYPAPLIKHLNQRWPDDLEAVKWYDLENELLNYYLSRKGNPDYPDVVSPELLEYIRQFDLYRYTCRSFSAVDDEMEELVNLGYGKYGAVKHWASIPYQEDFKQSQFWRDRKALQLIKDGLCKYLKSIIEKGYNPESAALNVLFAAETMRKSGNLLNIYTFNYTQLPVDYGNGFRDIVHYVHGSCADNRIIVGTRDDVSIDEDYDFLQKSFDPHFNPPALVADLLEADEVIIFGHSIGENDRQYFKAFFKQQTDYSHPMRKDITIFTRDEASEVQIKRSLQQMTDGNLSTLYGLNHIQIIKTANLAEDQHKMIDFLVNHHIERNHAEVILGQLIKDEAQEKHLSSASNAHNTPQVNGLK